MTSSLSRPFGQGNNRPLDRFLFRELGLEPANRSGIRSFVVSEIIGDQIIPAILIDIKRTYTMNSEYLVGNLVHFPLGGGRILVRTFEPKESSYIGTDKVEIPIPIDIM